MLKLKDEVNFKDLLKYGYKRLCDANKIKVKKWYGLFLTKKGYKFMEVKPNVDIFNKCKELYDYMKGEK